MLFVITFPCLIPALSAATAPTSASERPSTPPHTQPLCLLIAQDVKHSKQKEVPLGRFNG
ncbi:hypothetical protein K160097B7_17130 [[Clostridium] hylemonae]